MGSSSFDLCHILLMPLYKYFSCELLYKIHIYTRSRIIAYDGRHATGKFFSFC